MTEISVAQGKKFPWVRISNDLSLSNNTCPHINQILPVGGGDAVICSRSGIFRTLGSEVYHVFTKPVLGGGIATNRCGDIVLAEADGTITIIDRQGARISFGLGQIQDPISFDLNAPEQPIADGVFLATNIVGDRIAIVVEDKLTVFARDGTIIRREELESPALALAVVGENVLLAQYAGESGTDVVLYEFGAQARAYLGTVRTGDAVANDPECLTQYPAAFSADGSRFGVVVPILSDSPDFTPRMYQVDIHPSTVSAGTRIETRSMHIEGGYWGDDLGLVTNFDGSRFLFISSQLCDRGNSEYSQSDDWACYEIGKGPAGEDLAVVKEEICEYPFVILSQSGGDLVLEFVQNTWKFLRQAP